MNILFLGSSTGTGGHRAGALRRLGHAVRQINPDLFAPQGRLAAKLHWETGGVLCEGSVARQTLAQVGEAGFDVVWVDNVRYVGPTLVRAFQQRGARVLNYNVDDPYGRRDRLSWSLYKKAVPFYDLVAVVRQENVAEADALGSKKTLRVYRSADEAAHAPRELTEEDRAKWGSEIVFVGTYMPERGPFMAELVERGVPLSIYGNLWQRAKEWPVLRDAWKGPGTTRDDDYARAVQCAKVSLGLLSKGNRDLHTTRSLEVPALGTVFCAERTAEHQYLYCEGEEAVFWADAAECAAACRTLLANDGLRREIARRGRARCLQNGTMNEVVMSQVMEQALS